MPTYAHTTKAAGTVLAGGASGNYNTDHQNHVTNQVPLQTDDYSPDTATMRTVADPYPSGSESPPTDLAGELTRLRYQLSVLLDYINGHAPDGAATGAITPSTVLASNYWYQNLKNPMLRTIGCRVSKAAVMSHPTSGTASAMTFDTESYDLDGAATGFHESVTNPSRITIPTGLDGVYHIGGTVSFASSATGVLRAAYIVQGGTTYLASQNAWYRGATAAAVVELTLHCDVKLAAGNYVELWVNQDSGGAMNIAGPNATAGPAFWGHLIGYGA